MTTNTDKVMTLGDKIRALKLTGRTSMPIFDSSWNAALDRAAALADEQQDNADALVAAAYVAAGVRARHLWHDSQDAEEVEIGINNLTDADARAALDRIKAEAHRAGMQEAAGNAKVWVIIDRANHLFYSRTHNPTTGWYTENLANAHIYSSYKAAKLIVDSQSFKVSHPGNRKLEVRAFSLSPSKAQE